MMKRGGRGETDGGYSCLLKEKNQSIFEGGDCHCSVKN